MLAVDLNLESWPLLDPWQGSSRMRGSVYQKLKQMRKLVAKCSGIAPPDPIGSLTDVEEYLNSWAPVIEQAGANSIHEGEWLVNSLVPWYASSLQQGALLWELLPPPRHYGFERRLAQWWQISPPISVLQQQGWLAWWQKYCNNHSCASCPLVRDVSALAELN
jgi:hypothetical protein